MAFEKGHQKCGGREVGTKNRPTTLYEYLKRRDADPRKLLVKFLQGAGPKGVKFDWVMKVLEFIEPKPKALGVKELKDLMDSTKPKSDVPLELDDYNYLTDGVDYSGVSPKCKLPDTEDEE